MPSPPSPRIIALLVTVSFLLGSRAPAQETASQKPDYSQEAVVIERMTDTYRFERDGTGRHEGRVRVKVQSAEGVERFGQLVFSYNSANEKLDMDFVRVLKADGTVVNATPSDIQDLTADVTREAPVYTDARQKHVTVRGLRAGDVLEYQMVWKTHTALAPNHFWVEHNFITEGSIVLDNQLTIDLPVASKVKVKTQPGFDPPTIKEENDRRIYAWKHAKLKPDEEKKKDEEAESEEPEEPSPHVQLTTFQSWDEVGQWYADLQRDRIVPDEKIKAKAEAVISGRTTDKEKVRALYDYVSKNFRYVSLSLGQGRYQSHAAASVLNNQYGDCKDKHTLLAAMLAATGLRAFPVLIGASRALDVDMPSPAQFNHVISAIPLGNETLWADTTAEITPLGLLEPALRDKKVLLIPGTGPARVETTPADPPYRYSELITVEGAIDDLGKLTARARMVLRGDYEIGMRIAFRGTPKSDWKILGPFIGIRAGLEGDVSDIKISDPADTEKPFEIEFNVAIPHYLDWSIKKEKFELPFPPFHLSQLKAGKAGSTKPVKLGPPSDITYMLKLTLPIKYQARAPVPLKVLRDYAEYASNYKLEGQTLTAERTLRVRQRELPAEREQDYHAFVTALESDSAQTLALESTMAGTPAIPESIAADELRAAAQVAANNGDFTTAEVMLTRVLAKDPKDKTIRNVLGYVLAEQEKYDAALQVLREQIKINPFDDFAYYMLGIVYWGQEDYANAEKSFRKQLQVNPLSQSTHAKLGQMLVDAGKYKEAIVELERAVSMTREEDYELHMGLGRAYLYMGNTEKSLPAFEAAIKINRSPHVLNDIAYYLSESEVHLDKAVQYAETAVTTITNNLRNVETANLKIDDLYNVSSLAGYWDTLGWIYYQQDIMDKAEAYLRASYMLHQHGSAAYNLGIVTEERGQKQEAIRFFAQASVVLTDDQDAQKALRRLARKADIPSLLRAAKQDLRAYNIFDVGQLVPDLKSPVEAEFFLVYAPDSTRAAQAVDVKFIKGDERLRPLAAQLKTIKYQLTFPDNSPTRIIRRGALLCLPKPGACTFTMTSPELVRSVD
ncbi:MAG TPA: DUF3857 domain-containing protein [Pyrinomonadaceae bacterium]|nr:DUF3857 domain-containing protein [Pyrinomonadaceae bacterium]